MNRDRGPFSEKKVSVKIFGEMDFENFGEMTFGEVSGCHQESRSKISRRCILVLSTAMLQSDTGG